MGFRKRYAAIQEASSIPAKYALFTLLKRDGEALFDHHRHTLEALGNEKGTSD